MNGQNISIEHLTFCWRHSLQARFTGCFFRSSWALLVLFSVSSVSSMLPGELPRPPVGPLRLWLPPIKVDTEAGEGRRANEPTVFLLAGLGRRLRPCCSAGPTPAAAPVGVVILPGALAPLPTVLLFPTPTPATLPLPLALRLRSSLNARAATL